MLDVANSLLDAFCQIVPGAETLRIGPHGHAVRLQSLTQGGYSRIVVRGMRQEDHHWHRVPSL